MADSGVFKTSAVGGFDKRSVLSYIDSMNENFRTIELEYQNKLDEFAKSQESQIAYIKKLESQIAQKNSECSTLQEQLSIEREKADQVKGSSEGQAAQMQKKIMDLERDIQIQIERNRQLQFKIESVDYKSKRYDEFSTQIGDALIEAKKNAEQIVEQANVKARSIVSQAEHYMKNFQQELGSFQSDTVRLRKSIEEISYVLSDRVDIMQEIVKQVETRLDYDPQVEFDHERQAENEELYDVHQGRLPENYYSSVAPQPEYDDE